MTTTPSSQLSLATLTGDAIRTVLEELAALRIEVFREWPYLYDGDRAYEERYLGKYAMSPRAAVIVAQVIVAQIAHAAGGEGGTGIVGASTALPTSDATLRAGLVERGIDADRTCYFGESVLRRAYRGQGIGVAFFEAREAFARSWGATHVCFAAVERDPDDPRRPAGDVPLDGFWHRRGFEKIPDLALEFAWKETGATEPTPHRLGVWMKRLAP